MKTGKNDIRVATRVSNHDSKQPRGWELSWNVLRADSQEAPVPASPPFGIR